MEILAVLAVMYLVAAPDRVSLALTRGLFGAARGAATGKTPKARKKSPRQRAMFDGWREGVAAARTRRDAGRDLWSRGSRGAGRVAGGTASLARGIHGTVRARRNRADVDQPSSSTDDAAPKASRGWAFPRRVRRPRTAPTSDASGLVVDQDGNSVTPDPEQAPEPAPTAPEAVPDAAPRAPESTTAPKTPETALTPAPESAPTGATTTNTNTAPNGAIAMSLANTELSNIDDYEKELKAVEAAVGLVAEAMDKVRKWGNNLPERWTAAGWGTAGLDRSVTNIAETVGALKMPAVAEAFAAARTEVTKARGLGEAAEAVKARGKTEAFRGN
ncbi:hypothetical protein [Kribbella sp. CA-247076]|uniref:hypothetical protein n=1 Tax=Kribbella sp. CA-247076 TaxID=3239941 RepID=UPI003D91E7E8